jgi:hypothetical protein
MDPQIDAALAVLFRGLAEAMKVPDHPGAYAP